MTEIHAPAKKIKKERDEDQY